MLNDFTQFGADSNWIRIIRYVVPDPIIYKMKIVLLFVHKQWTHSIAPWTTASSRVWINHSWQLVCDSGVVERNWVAENGSKNDSSIIECISIFAYPQIGVVMINSLHQLMDNHSCQFSLEHNRLALSTRHSVTNERNMNLFYCRTCMINKYQYKKKNIERPKCIDENYC